MYITYMKRNMSVVYTWEQQVVSNFVVLLLLKFLNKNKTFNNSLREIAYYGIYYQYIVGNYKPGYIPIKNCQKYFI